MEMALQGQFQNCSNKYPSVSWWKDKWRGTGEKNKKIPDPDKARKKIQSQCEVSVLQDTFILCGIAEINSVNKVKQSGRKYNLLKRYFCHVWNCSNNQEKNKPGITIWLKDCSIPGFSVFCRDCQWSSVLYLMTLGKVQKVGIKKRALLPTF